MIPIISIIGRSESGKTTLIEKLIPELVRRNYKVATVKHDVHSFEIDKKGKDSWRHKNAGASIAIVSSPKRITIFRDSDRDLFLEELRDAFINGVDIILAEGYKKSKYPKIEVNRSAIENDLLCTEDDRLIAIVSDLVGAYCNTPLQGVPVFDPEDIVELANLIEEKYLNHTHRNIKPCGRIVIVNINKKKGTKKNNVDRALLIENYGVENDAHAGPGHRQVSLLAIESINKMKEKGLNVEPGSFAENITTEGIDLPNLPIGAKLQIGDEVVFEITQIGKVCHNRCAIYYRVGDCVMPREGVFAKVTRGGWIEKGDEIKVVKLESSFHHPGRSEGSRNEILR